MAAAVKGSTRKCAQCGRKFAWRPPKKKKNESKQQQPFIPPMICGAVDCRFRAEATATQWEGRARLAAARRAADSHLERVPILGRDGVIEHELRWMPGVVPNDIDDDALDRFPVPRSIWFPRRTSQTDLIAAD